MQIALNLQIVKCQIFHTKKSPFEPQSEKVCLGGGVRCGKALRSTGRFAIKTHLFLCIQKKAKKPQEQLKTGLAILHEYHSSSQCVTLLFIPIFMA